MPTSVPPDPPDSARQPLAQCGKAYKRKLKKTRAKGQLNKQTQKRLKRKRAACRIQANQLPV